MSNIAPYRSTLLFLTVFPLALASVAVSVLILVMVTGFTVPTVNPQKPTKAEMAATVPRFRGLTVDEALDAFTSSSFTKLEDEHADLYTSKLNMGESSVTINISSYAPDVVSGASIVVHRPGHDRGPMLDRLAGEYLPRLLALPYDGAEPEKAKRWLRSQFLRMSLSGHSAETTIGDTVYTLNVIRSRATLRMTPVSSN